MATLFNDPRQPVAVDYERRNQLIEDLKELTEDQRLLNQLEDHRRWQTAGGDWLPPLPLPWDPIYQDDEEE